ncbi:MAG: hypothetical protein HY553_17520 [Elusimicrobia bacterium]|nr:hypothetical protein [Elusimicrobiota bacterium]
MMAAILGLALWALCPFGASAAEAAPATPARISAEFAIPAERVRGLHERERLSYAEIRTALILSRETGRSLDEILGLRRAGVSFDAIAARHRLDLGELIEGYEQERAERTRSRPSREAVRSKPPRGGPPPKAVPAKEPEPDRPLWDSPSNPFEQQEWSNQNQWRLNRDRR